MSSPRVTVLLCVHNEERYVAAAVESILGQTFRDFELLIIDDGSTDDTPAILDRYDDSRIRRITRENRGLTPSLNEGLERASAPLIARQDADDISLPSRLEREIAFLDRHPEVALVGTNYTIIDLDGAPIDRTRVFTHPDDIAVAQIFANQFGHGTVVFRRELALQLGGYATAAGDIVSDHDLWNRMRRHARLANVSEPLYQWRRTGASLSTADRELAIEQTNAIRDREFALLLDDSAGARVFASFHPGSMPLRTYLEKKAVLFRSLAWMYRAHGRAGRAVAAQAAAVICEPWRVRNTLFLLGLVRHARSAAPLWDYEFP